MKANIAQEKLDTQRLAIGARIKDLRLQRGMTQQDLAAATGMGVTQISKVEAGKWNFGIDTITLFSEHLKFKFEIKA